MRIRITAVLDVDVDEEDFTLDEKGVPCDEEELFDVLETDGYDKVTATKVTDK